MGEVGGGSDATALNMTAKFKHGKTDVTWGWMVKNAVWVGDKEEKTSKEMKLKWENTLHVSYTRWFCHLSHYQHLFSCDFYVKPEPL